MRIAALFLISLSFIACHKRRPTIAESKPIETVKGDSISVSRFPLPVGAVNDFENILSISEEKELMDTIEAFEKRSGNDIAIVTIDSIKPYEDIASYANELGNTWGVGDSAKGNGLLIVLSKKLRQVRVATGKGTEKILSDRFCKKVIERDMLPEFKSGNYYTGLKKGVNSLIREWEKH